MSAASATLAGRRAAERLMVDSCTISAASTRGALNATTGEYDVVPGAVLYTGPCRVVPAAGNQDHVVDAGEQPVSLWPFIVSVPMSVADVTVDHEVEITSSELDPRLVGTRLRVRQVALGTHITARRLGCEVTAG